MPFSCDQSDSLEDFSPEGSSCNSSDHVDGILLPPDEVSPGHENVPVLLDVSVS